MRSQINLEKGKVLKPIKDRMLLVENKIERGESEIEQINQELVAASSNGKGSKIAELSRRLHILQVEVDGLYDELESLTVALETHRAEFEKRLARLESENS